MYQANGNKFINPKSNAYWVIRSNIHLQRLNLDKSASVDIFTNRIIWLSNRFEKKTLFSSEKFASKEELLQE